MVTTPKGERSLLVRGALLALLAVGTVVLIVIYLIDPVISYAIAGILVIVMTTVRAPEWTLAVAAVLTMAGGNFVALTSLGYVAAFVGGAVSLLALISRREIGQVLSGLALPLFLLLFCSVRFLAESDWNSTWGIVKCLSIMILAADVVLRKRDFVLSLGIAGLVFSVASVLAGEYNLAHTRLLGFTGNPNRLVFAVLLLMPFLIALILRIRPRAPRAILLAGVFALNAFVIVQTGSSQGYVGYVILTLVLIGMALRRRSKIAAGIFWALSGALVLAAFTVGDVVSILPSDLNTLSGRVGLFSSAWSEFFQNPFFGSGNTSIDFGVGEERSTHSVLLTFLITAGIAAGVMWAAILVRQTMTGFRQISVGNAIGLAPIMLLTEQSVQAVAFTPLAWGTVTLTLLARPERWKKGAHDD